MNISGALLKTAGEDTWEEDFGIEIGGEAVFKEGEALVAVVYGEEGLDLVVC
jgi:hypothetical protein